eukprot:2508686-Amphidinium_carterae.1
MVTEARTATRTSNKKASLRVLGMRGAVSTVPRRYVPGKHHNAGGCSGCFRRPLGVFRALAWLRNERPQVPPPCCAECIHAERCIDPAIGNSCKIHSGDDPQVRTPEAWQ